MKIRFLFPQYIKQRNDTTRNHFEPDYNTCILILDISYNNDIDASRQNSDNNCVSLALLMTGDTIFLTEILPVTWTVV